MALRERDLCVCQVTAFLDLAPSTTSKHLSVLRQARLIDSYKRGKWVYYHLATESASKLVRSSLDMVMENLKENPSILKDNEHIKKVLEREDLLCAGMDAEHQECRHSLEIHLLEEEDI